MTITIASNLVSLLDAVLIGSNNVGYYLPQGILVASPNNDGFLTTGTHTTLRVDGTLIAKEVAAGYSATATYGRMVVGETGIVSSLQETSLVTAVYGGNNFSLFNHGQISAPGSITVGLGSSSELTNTGTIVGLTGVRTDGGNAQISNFGLIQASSNFVGPKDHDEGVGIIVEADGTSIFNSEDGRIATTAPGGVGVGTHTVADNLRIENHGEISATYGVGVDFSGMDTGTGLLVNAGLVYGSSAAFVGNSTGDIVRNGGTMSGDVQLNDGNDVFRTFGEGKVLGTVDGGAGDDTINGGVFEDVMSGGAGDDIIYGRDGDDTIDGDDGDDVIYGALGDDSLSGGDDEDHLIGKRGEDSLNGGAGLDTLRGGLDGDTLNGGDGNDHLYGARGDDLLNGGVNNDLLSGGKGEDTLNGDIGIDILYGGAGDDVLNAGTWNDQLNGGSGDDELNGEGGNDIMNGGSGADTMTGGTGNDVFVFDRGNDSVYVSDYLDGADRIDLRSWNFANLLDLQNKHTVVDTDAGVRFDFGEGDVLLVRGSTLATLDFFDFIF